MLTPLPILGFFWAAFWVVAKMAIVAGISYGLALALRKKPKGPKAATLDQIEFPSLDPSEVFCVIHGTPTRQKGLFVHWYGDLVTDSFHKDGVKAGYYYYLGAHLLACRSGIDGVIQMWYGEKCMWPTRLDPTQVAADGETTATINDLWLYGYREGEGGFHSHVRLLYGASAQARDDYLEAQLGSDIPAFRGIVSLVFPMYPTDAWNTWWGTTPYIKLISILERATNKNSDDTEIWYVAKARIGTYDKNPAHIIRQSLIDTEWGEGEPAARMGATFTTVADTLYAEGAEGFGLSYRYKPEPGNLQPFIDEVLDTINGFLWEDPVADTIEIGLARDDYELASLTEYDETDLTIVQFDVPQWGDLPGRILLKYSDRLYPEPKTVAYDDIAVQAKQGGRIGEQVVELKGIYDDDLAAMVVNRIGRAACYPLATMTVRTKRTMSGLHVGSVFKLAYDDPDLSITQMAVRVMKIRKGSEAENGIEMELVEDIFRAADSIYASTPGSSWTPPTIDYEASGGEVVIDRLTAETVLDRLTMETVYDRSDETI